MSSLQWLAMARHGESIGNVAWRAAESDGLEKVDLLVRDPDIPLSETGRRQAAALGRGIAALPAAERPTAVLSSPYVRAAETARIAFRQLPGASIRFDERLRDRDTGVLYALTERGVAARFPEEAARERLLGTFSYRPPGGESWADVAIRLRGALSDVERAHPDGRVLVVAHDALVVLTRYVVERLTERQVLGIERIPVPNGSLTTWTRENGALRLVSASSIDHLVGSGPPA